MIRFASGPHPEPDTTMRHAHLPAAVLAAGLLTSTPAQSSDLALDGQTNLSVPIGTTIDLTLDGGAQLPALIGLDLTPGPIELLGESIPIGFTPAFSVLAEGLTDPSGRFTLSAPISLSPSLVGQTVFLVGALIDPADSNGLDISNGASLTFEDEPGPIEVELFGVTRPGAPFFDWVTTIQGLEPIAIAVDPGEQPQVVGATAAVYLVADRSEDEWDLDPNLIDLSGDGPDTVTFTAGGIQANTFQIDPGTLTGDNGPIFGTGYDVVVDLDGDGQLSVGDLVDGYEDRAGFYVTVDPTTPGPYTVTEAVYSGGTLLGQNLFYPAEIAQLDARHLVVVSHGNGHNYLWYDHIGTHLASWGYVVMSHQNNTGPGIESASTTTLTNTEFLLANLDQIEGGVLDGKIIRDEIVWIGHSRGGEGIVRAYDRLVDNNFTSPEFDESDIALLSSIAPTVFFNQTSSDPHAVDYHLWTGAGDSDVNGCAQSGVTQCFRLMGRAEDQRQAIALYGVGHAWFHNGTGSFIQGPCQLDRPRTHQIMRGYLLPLVEWHVRENAAARDFLVRQYEDLRPRAIETELDNPCVIANLIYVERAGPGKFVIEDMQADTDDLIASSGIPITTDLDGWFTLIARDRDATFTYVPADVTNGATWAIQGEAERSGALLHEAFQDRTLAFELDAGTDDWTAYRWLTFRLAQTTRAPLTTAGLEDQHFAVRLVDADGDSALIRTDALLAGVEEPYQRTGCGQGTGWNAEFESIRMGLKGFRAIEPALDLDSLERLEFLFGPSFGSLGGQLMIDDIELHVD